MRHRSSGKRRRTARPAFSSLAKAAILIPRKPLRDSTVIPSRSPAKPEKKRRSTIMRQITYLQAIGEAMREEMRRDPHVFIMGEDVEANVFGTMTGFNEEFGADHFPDIPLSAARSVTSAIASPT